MITIPQEVRNYVANKLVGKDVIPILVNNDKKLMELPMDRFALSDDGFYLDTAGLIVLPNAILNRNYNPFRKDTKIELELDEDFLKIRGGFELPWQ